MISKNLYDALVDWKSTNNEEKVQTSKQAGLCVYIIDYGRRGTYIELLTLFEKEFGLNCHYPFNANDADYYQESNEKLSYLNKSRHAWVDAKIAEYEAQGVVK